MERVSVVVRMEERMVRRSVVMVASLLLVLALAFSAMSCCEFRREDDADDDEMVEKADALPEVAATAKARDATLMVVWLGFNLVE